MNPNLPGAGDPLGAGADASPTSGSGDDSRNYGLAERHESSLLSLFELSHELGAVLDPYQIAQIALFNLMGRFGTSKAVLWLFPEDGRQDAVPLRWYGLRERLVRALGAGLATHAQTAFAAGPGPIRLADSGRLELERNLSLTSSAVSRAPAVSLALEGGIAILTPLGAHGRLVGQLALGARVTGEPYGPIDLQHLAAAAGMVGVALRNARIHHRMLEANRQLRLVNEHLQEADELRSELIQNLNHELRTPVAILNGYLSTVVDAWSLSDAQRNTVGILKEQCDRLTGLLQNLLDFAAVTRNSMKLHVDEGDVAPLLRDYADGRRPGVLEGPREFIVEIPTQLPRIPFDGRRLIQMVDALVDNAVKFTPPGTRIRLRATPGAGDSSVSIQVEDNGPGIPRAHLTSLFEPFRQVDGSSTRTVGGLGLGLALVRQIAEQMGARLDVQSQLNAGTTFTIVLGVGIPASNDLLFDQSPTIRGVAGAGEGNRTPS